MGEAIEETGFWSTRLACLEPYIVKDVETWEVMEVIVTYLL